MWNSKQYELESAESSDLSNMNMDNSTANLNQGEQENMEVEGSADTTMTEKETDLPPDPSTPTRSFNSPNKSDESPNKKAKTRQTKDTAARPENSDLTELNPNDKSKAQKPKNNNFGKVASSRVSAGKKKKKTTTNKTYLRVKLPTQVENVQQ